MRNLIQGLTPRNAKFVAGQILKSKGTMNPFLWGKLIERTKATEPEPVKPVIETAWDRFDLSPEAYEHDWEAWRAGDIDAEDLVKKWRGRTPARKEILAPQEAAQVPEDEVPPEV